MWAREMFCCQSFIQRTLLGQVPEGVMGPCVHDTVELPGTEDV